MRGITARCGTDGCADARNGWRVQKLQAMNDVGEYISIRMGIALKLKSDNFLQLDKMIRKEKIASCLIYQDNQTVYQYYKNRKMEDKLFSVNSVTKSVISILIGIAIDEELIDLQTPISTYFPQFEASLSNITIEHIITMTPGLEWGEFGEWGGRPFPMINSKDWVKFTLDKKRESDPGTKMTYHSGCSHLLSAILQKVSGQKASAFAEEKLFKPLGISEYRWYEDSKGITIGGFGICLKSTDLMKIGIMMLQDGMWNKKNVVSQDWVAQSTTSRYCTYGNIGAYGYHWWVLNDENGQVYEPHIYFAMGYGGNYIIVSKAHKLVVVFTSELYNNTFLPFRMFRENILSEFVNTGEF